MLAISTCAELAFQDMFVKGSVLGESFFVWIAELDNFLMRTRA